MATLVDMADRVKFKLGNKEAIDTHIDAALNQAVLQITWEKRPHEMTAVTGAITLTDLKFAYTFNVTSSDLAVEDVYAILVVRNNTNNFPLHEGTIYEFEGRDQTGTTGTPSKWVRRANSLLFYDAIPGTDVIRVTYLKRPATMTRGSGGVDFPLNDEWVRPTEDLACAMLWSDLNKFEYASGKYQSYDLAMGKRQTPRMIEDEAPSAGIIFPANRYDE